MNAKKSKLFAWTTLTIAQIGYVPLTSTSLMPNSNRFRAVTPLTQHCFEMLLKMYNEEKKWNPFDKPKPKPNSLKTSRSLNGTHSAPKSNPSGLLIVRLLGFSFLFCCCFIFSSINIIRLGGENSIPLKWALPAFGLFRSGWCRYDGKDFFFFLFLLEGNFVNTGFIAI